MSWRDQLESMTSLGSAHQGVTRLADLAQARTEHLGQFFTPLAIVHKMWMIVEQACVGIADEQISILDNSVGSGRLLHFADPARHALYGIDVHEPVVRALQEAGEQAGFTCEFALCPMERARPKGFQVALINPPFSLNLQSPYMQPLECTRWGKFGPNTGATSDEYALAQALHAAQLVVAVLPTSMADDLISRGAGIVGEQALDRMAAVLDLGTSVFKEEGANIAVSLAVFAPGPAGGHIRQRVADLAAWTPPKLPVEIAARRGTTSTLRIASGDAGEPAITMPVTGDPVVRVVHSGRKIHLKFRCGLMQAKCLNSVYKARIYSTETHRLPKGVQYAGQGVLDVESLVAAEDFESTWARLISDLQSHGTTVEVDPGLRNHLEVRRREAERQNTPFGRWIWSEQCADSVEATAKVAVALHPASWVSPMVKAGETARLTRDGADWALSVGEYRRSFSDDEARKLFELPAVSEGWIEITPPLQRVYPEIAASLRARALALGLDSFLNWQYQFEDLIEVCIRPGGCVVGWKQGLGKARLAVAIPLLLNAKHALIAMPAFLLDEFPDRLRDAGLDPSLWQVITSAEHVRNLRRINVISYERLRTLMPGGKGIHAAALRRRCAVVVCDEGEVLANDQSDQSRAVRHLAAKRLYILTGTPQANYPRDLLKVGIAAAGDAVAGQSYGMHRPVLDHVNVKTMEFAERGVTKFADDFISFEWVTNEFAETLSDGAKREVPRINNLQAYREWIQPWIKRRLPGEPEVAKFVKIRPAQSEILELEWDKAHLAHYLRVADEFARWWMDRRRDKRGQNLVALLARIGAVEHANNAPQTGDAGGPSMYCGGLTSKQHWVVNRTVELAADRKLVVYAKSPALLELLSRELATCGVQSVLYHGEIGKKQRRRDLQRFRHEEVNVLLASFGVTRAGLDLYQAEHAIFASRLWSQTQEDQAVYRLLRPQQTRQVRVEKPHLRGGIDLYMDQLVSWKASAANAGLDWAAPMGEDVEFLHLDQVLGQFVEGLARMHDMKSYEFREWLKEAA